MSVFTIAGREFRSIFNTTIGWLVMAGFLLLTGYFWASMLTYYAANSAIMAANPYAGAPMSFGDGLFVPFFGNTAVVLMLACPAISMRLFSEEQKQRTLELLLTSPVSTIEIVLGKFLGAVGFVAVLLLGTAIGPLLLELRADPDLGAVAAGYAGLLLFTSATLAMGMLFSALTANQIVALVLGFVSALTLWILSWASQDPTSVFVELATVTHVQPLLTGVLNAKDLAYFAGFIGFFLFATWQRIESFRWS